MRTWMFLFATLVAGSCASQLLAEQLPADEQAFLDKQISKLLKIEPTRLGGLGLEQVFKEPVYSVGIHVAHPDGGTESMTLLVGRVGDDLIDISLPGTDADLPQFAKLVDPKFKLKTQKDAQAVQEALDVIYPISKGFGDEDLKAKAIKHVGNEWRFIRGKFFEKHKGFVFKTDAKGTITAVRFSLQLP